ncbi:MAG: hypothetical protein DRG30_05420 [Epsilonproteobacteria bacterium]|nr:MAG: hypothetical protein DRG30_05420 [Campylobacterota bacterium]
MKTTSRVLSMLFVLALLFSGCGDTKQNPIPVRPAPEEPVPVEPTPQEPAPSPGLPIVNQTTVTTTDGEVIQVKETEAGFIFVGYEGKIVLLEFYGSTCPHCMADIPMYNSLQAKYGDRLVVIAVETYGQLNNAALRDFANSHNMQYRTIAKENSGNLYAYAQSLVGTIGGVPYLIVLDGDGEIVTTGLNAFSESQLDSIIQGL